MDVNVGDTIRFLNEKGGGIVVRLERNDIVQVQIEDGFVIPVHKSEIVVVNDENKKKDIRKADPVVPPVEIKKQEPYVSNVSYNYAGRDEWSELEELDKELKESHINVYLGFVPADPKNPGFSDTYVYLINDSNYLLLYNVAIPAGNAYSTISSGKLEEDTKLHISTLKSNDINSVTKYIVQIIAVRKGIYQLYHPVEKTVKTKPSKFFKWNSYVSNDFFDEKAIIIPVSDDAEAEEEIKNLSNEELKKIIEEKELFSATSSNDDAVKSEPKKTEEIEEVDLHIQKLVDDFKGMSNAEMLITQISHFRTKLENAILQHRKKIVFIHGVGNGTLKHELRKILETHYSEHKYQDASFKEYGYGATLVIIK